MEFKNLESDIQSLRKLYRLLQVTEIGLQSESVEYLDENARIFLRGLLDGATEKLFETADSKLRGMKTPATPLDTQNSLLKNRLGSEKVVRSTSAALLKDLRVPARRPVSKGPDKSCWRTTQGLRFPSAGPTNLANVASGRSFEMQIQQASSTSSCEASVWQEDSLSRHARDRGSTASTSCSDREECSLWTGASTSSSKASVWEQDSLPRHARDQCSTASTSCSDGEECSLPGQTGLSYTRSTSSSVVSPSSISVGSPKESRSGSRVKSKLKQKGGFRRLKDKLSLIFHHHHHHHLHQQHHEDGSRRDRKTKAGRGTSLWKKSAGKIFRGTTSTGEVYAERAAEEHLKTVARKLPEKNQHGHFHALVKRLLRHARNSKKSKLPKGGIKRLGSSKHGSKKAVKKLKWWQTFRRQRAVKAPKKPRVKLGFGKKKKPRSRALPHLT